MNAFGIVSLVVGIVGLGFGWYALSERARRKQRGVFRPWPIRTVQLAELDPVFTPTEFGPGLATEVQFVGQVGIHGGATDLEAWILAVLAKQAKHLFEFGTCTGKTTYLWARNAPADAKILTLTLGPDQKGTYVKEAGDGARDSRRALGESAYDHFYYTNTAVAGRITQLFNDSKHFDDAPYAGQFDLIFVDGSHALSYVLSDSEKALRMCKPGGLILWHDYVAGRNPGVFKGLNRLAQRLPLVHVAGTKFVAYRKPLR